MKICTITCHDVYNYGASLQTVALYQYLKSSGHDIEVIDYKPTWLSRRYDLWKRNGKWKRKSLFFQLLYYFFVVPIRWATWKGMRSFDKYSLKNFKISNKEYKDNLELTMDPPIADVYIVGSDQVWNPSTAHFLDPAFFLDFVPAGKTKLSYAASFGVSEIAPEMRPMIKQFLSSFSGISIREKQGLEILKNSGVNNAQLVVDPVFLLNSETWLTMAAKKVSNAPYILVYDFDENPMIKDCVSKHAKAKGLKVFSMNSYKKSDYADADFKDAGPDVFLSLLLHANFIYSNSFHATAFSIIFKKNFYSAERIKFENNSRIHNILEICELSDRLIYNSEFTPKEITCEAFDNAHIRLSSHIDNSKAFLQKFLPFT